MFSHIAIGISDLDRALAFWSPIMARLGHVHCFTDTDQPGAGWEPAGGGRPLFVVTTPYDGAPATTGNGAMTAFVVADRASVDAVHVLATGTGGTDDGPPGLRPHYHRDYYGCYFRDPDGNKIAVACHASVTAAADRGPRKDGDR